jgi:hypothetical protein
MKLDGKNYLEADDIRTKKPGIKYLIFVEGDSALPFVKRIIFQSDKLNMSNCGFFLLGGVPINVLNRMHHQYLSDFSFVDEKLNNKSVLLMDEKCQKSNFIGLLLFRALGIQLNTNPDDILKVMNYDYYIIASDQDKDGWNINGILLAFFSKFPLILSNQRVKRLQTPIARVKPKDVTISNAHKAIEFFTTEDLESWLKQNKVPPGMEISYYKGLGSNENEFSAVIARNIDNYLYTFVADKAYLSNIHKYYDKENPHLRRQELVKPIRALTNVEKKLWSSKLIAITTFLDQYVKSYQLYNLNRKLLDVLGGNNSVTNKLVYSLDKIFTQKQPKAKVAHMASIIIDNTNYGHGENSVMECIFHQTQIFPGSTNIHPVLIGLGQFGTRILGGKDHASARYVKAECNRDFKNLLYPDDDKCAVIPQYEEGDMIEPRFQLPVLPVALMKNYKTAAHGWKVEIWARDTRAIVNSLLALIDGRQVQDELPINKNNLNCKFVKTILDDQPRLYSVGKYQIEGNDLVLTELPLGVWIKPYIESLVNSTCPIMNKILVSNPVDHSVDNILIRIPLVHGWQDLITKREHPIFNDIELFFKLKVRLCDELNYIAPNGSVIEFESYLDLLKYWFEERKKYYIIRINRQIEILKNKILLQTNICNYLANFKTWGLSGVPESQVYIKLVEENIHPINIKMISPNSLVPIHLISKLLLITKTCNNLSEADFVTYHELVELKIITGYADYEYLNSIRNDALRSDKLQPRLDKLNKLKDKLAMLEATNSWKTIWKNEISRLKPYMT